MYDTDVDIFLPIIINMTLDVFLTSQHPAWNRSGEGSLYHKSMNNLEYSNLAFTRFVWPSDPYYSNPAYRPLNCQRRDISSWKIDFFLWSLILRWIPRSTATHASLCNTLSSNKYLVKILAIKWLRYNQDFYKIWNSVILFIENLIS